MLGKTKLEKSIDNNQPVIARFVSCSPTQLRLIADRMELSAVNATKKEKIAYYLTNDIVLYYDFVKVRPQVLGTETADNKVDID